MNNNSFIVGILVVIVVIVVGYLAYTQGFFQAKSEEAESGLQINLGGSTN